MKEARMSADQEAIDRSRRGQLGRRSLLLGAASAGTVLAFPQKASAATLESRRTAVPPGIDIRPARIATDIAPIPPVLRSRQALLEGTQAKELATLPLTQLGTTYNLAQEVRWLDTAHFAVGRWDGTMSIFNFETAPFVGPLITA